MSAWVLVIVVWHSIGYGGGFAIDITEFNSRDKCEIVKTITEEQINRTVPTGWLDRKPVYGASCVEVHK